MLDPICRTQGQPAKEGSGHEESSYSGIPQMSQGGVCLLPSPIIALDSTPRSRNCPGAAVRYSGAAATTGGSGIEVPSREPLVGV